MQRCRLKALCCSRKTPLRSTIDSRRARAALSMTFLAEDFRDTGRQDSGSVGDLPTLVNGEMSPTSQGGGRTPVCQTPLNSRRSGSSWVPSTLHSIWYVTPSMPGALRGLGQRFRAACSSQSVLAVEQRNTTLRSCGAAGTASGEAAGTGTVV